MLVTRRFTATDHSTIFVQSLNVIIEAKFRPLTPTLTPWRFLALLDCVSRANAVALASVVRPSVRRPSVVRP